MSGIFEDKLSQVRQKIDDIDEQLLLLMNKRAETMAQVAQIKAEATAVDQEKKHATSLEGKAGQVLYYRAEREAQVLEAIRQKNDGPLTDNQVITLFREIMSCCLSLQQPLMVSCLGPQGTYSESAMVKHFGHFVSRVYCDTIADVFAGVVANSAHYGVVPVENSTEGNVTRTLDCLLESKVYICGELELPIHHCILSSPNADAENLKKIYAHQQSFAQCRRWLDKHFPNLERIEVASNGHAAVMASEDTAACAIASSLAGEHYGLDVYSENIEDYTHNRTRFIVIGQKEVLKPSGKDKTSIIVSAHNRIGALHQILKHFADEDISLARLETRPLRLDEQWGYVFFIDFDGHVEEKHVRCALEKVKEVSIFVKVLGSYPKAVFTQ